MKIRTKKMILGGLTAGLVYAGLMAGFDYSDGQEFRIWRFLFNALFLGTFMGFITRDNVKKQSKKENKTD
jgi:hypothetical protein